MFAIVFGSQFGFGGVQLKQPIVLFVACRLVFTRRLSWFCRFFAFCALVGVRVEWVVRRNTASTVRPPFFAMGGTIAAEREIHVLFECLVVAANCVFESPNSYMGCHAS